MMSIECVLLLQIECVLLLQIECVLLPAQGKAASSPAEKDDEDDAR